MKNMYKRFPRFLAILVALLFAPTAFSLGVGSGPTSPLDRYITQISDRLDLTEDQQERIRPVLAANAAAMMSALQKRNEGAAGEKKMEPGEGQIGGKKRLRDGKVNGIQSETHESLSDILTPAQLAEFEKMKRENKARVLERVQSRRY